MVTRERVCGCYGNVYRGQMGNKYPKDCVREKCPCWDHHPAAAARPAPRLAAETVEEMYQGSHQWADKAQYAKGIREYGKALALDTDIDAYAELMREGTDLERYATLLEMRRLAAVARAEAAEARAEKMEKQLADSTHGYQWPTKALERLEARAEKLEVQLAACATAAQGGIKGRTAEARCGDYGWSPAYQDVVTLRYRAESAEAQVARVREMLDPHVLELACDPANLQQGDTVHALIGRLVAVTLGGEPEAPAHNHANPGWRRHCPGCGGLPSFSLNYGPGPANPATGNPDYSALRRRLEARPLARVQAAVEQTVGSPAEPEAGYPSDETPLNIMAQQCKNLQEQVARYEAALADTPAQRIVDWFWDAKNQGGNDGDAIFAVLGHLRQQAEMPAANPEQAVIPDVGATYGDAIAVWAASHS